MLIKALCDYYDILADAGKVLPEGYSSVGVHYAIALTPDGKMEDLVDIRRIESETYKGKEKKVVKPRIIMLPQRTEKTGIEANIVEHRPLYIFGLNYENETFTTEDKTGKAKKSHVDFVERNLQFIEGLSSPLIDAYRLFLEGWKPEEEIENPILQKLGKNYGKSSYTFCLSGEPGRFLSDDEQLKHRWEGYRSEADCDKNGVLAQCAISGKEDQIARIHNKIKGIYGGLATGSVLIGYKNASEQSYGNEQSYNSNISEIMMKKYTEALNYLLAEKTHKLLLDDITVIYWAMEPREEFEEDFAAFLSGVDEGPDANQMEQKLSNLLHAVKSGLMTEQDAESLEEAGSQIDFYMVGFKPNSSRVAMKFLYRKTCGEVLRNVVRFQKDLQVKEEPELVTLNMIKLELRKPNSKNDSINPELLAKIFQAAIYGGAYPIELLATSLRRVRMDKKITPVRAGIIKACINRNIKEEFGMSLDKENRNQAYLCGRLLAVLEKLQKEAAGMSLNRTIKDAYFAQASMNPLTVFPKLVRLAQYHIKNKNVKYPNYYTKMIGEIMDELQGSFPGVLTMYDQGAFCLGYYQQHQDFFKKNEK